MGRDLEDFLTRHTPLTEETVVWGRGRRATPLLVKSHLGDELPPSEYVTSVRGVVFRDDEVLVMRNPDEVHVLPGGQREAGETLSETLEREVLEEVGWRVSVGEMLGFVHLRHLGPKPPNFSYLYPDFAQVVFVVEAAEHEPESTVPDGYEVEAALRSVPEARDLDLSLAGRLFLDAAVRLREER